MNFTEPVKNEMRRKNTQTTQLAEMMGCSISYVSDLLCGRKRWNQDTINKACEALDLEIVVRKKRVKAAK